MTLEEFITYFEGVKRLNPSSYQCKCPAHQDDQASLTITQGLDKLLLHCHAGCDTATILERIGKDFSDLYKEKKEESATWKRWLEEKKQGSIQAVYDYNDEMGRYLYSKIRIQTRKGKTFVYGVVAQNRIHLSLGNIKKVLYHLPSIKKARETKEPLYMPEGEKDCATLERYGLLATTYGSSSDWKAEFAPLFAGIHLVVLPDNDKSGKQVADAIIKDCMPYVASMKQVMTSNKEKGDVTDYFNEEHNKEDFLCLVTNAPEIPLTMPLALPSSKQDVEKKAAEPHTKFAQAPITLKSGNWVCTNEGVYQWVTDKRQEGGEKKLYASRQQILPTGTIENMETGEQKYLISYSLRRNQRYLWRTIKVEPAICCSKTKIIALANVGIKVTDQTAKYLVNYIDDMYSINEDTLPVKKSISHLGWIKKEFFPYVTDISFDGDIEQEKVVQAIQEYGSFAIWQQACRTFRNNTLVRILMDACLASVLIEKVGGLCFVLHLWGMSGQGKTVALLVGASIWGNPDSLLSSADATANYCTNRAAFLKNLPVLIDETQIATVSKENSLDKLIYLMTEGKTRGRLDRNSKERNGKTWSCVSIFTGEKPIVDYKSGAGAVNRVIELELEESLFNDFGQALDVVRNHYGHAGKRFIEYIQKSNLEDITAEYHSICKEIAQISSATGKQSQSLGFLVLADRIAERCIFEKEPPLEISELVGFLKTEKEVSNAERAYEFILNWIAVNKNFFQKDSLKIYGKVDENTNTCLINQNELVRVLAENNYNFDSVKKEWASLGYLKKNSANKYQHYTTVFDGVKAQYIKLVLDEEKVSEDFMNIENIQIEIPFS